MQFKLGREYILQIIKDFPESEWEKKFLEDESSSIVFGLNEVVNYYDGHDPIIWNCLKEKSTSNFFEEKIKPLIILKKEYFDFLKWDDDFLINNVDFIDDNFLKEIKKDILCLSEKNFDFLINNNYLNKEEIIESFSLSIDDMQSKLKSIWYYEFNFSILDKIMNDYVSEEEFNFFEKKIIKNIEVLIQEGRFHFVDKCFNFTRDLRKNFVDWFLLSDSLDFFVECDVSKDKCFELLPIMIDLIKEDKKEYKTGILKIISGFDSVLTYGLVKKFFDIKDLISLMKDGDLKTECELLYFGNEFPKTQQKKKKII